MPALVLFIISMLRPSLITLFEAEQAVQISELNITRYIEFTGPDIFMSMVQCMS